MAINQILTIPDWQRLSTFTNSLPLGGFSQIYPGPNNYWYIQESTGQVKRIAYDVQFGNGLGTVFAATESFVDKRIDVVIGSGLTYSYDGQGSAILVTGLTTGNLNIIGSFTQGYVLSSATGGVFEWIAAGSASVQGTSGSIAKFTSGSSVGDSGMIEVISGTSGDPRSSLYVGMNAPIILGGNGSTKATVAFGISPSMYVDGNIFFGDNSNRYIGLTNSTDIEISTTGDFLVSAHPLLSGTSSKESFIHGRTDFSTYDRNVEFLSGLVSVNKESPTFSAITSSEFGFWSTKRPPLLVETQVDSPTFSFTASSAFLGRVGEYKVALGLSGGGIQIKDGTQNRYSVLMSTNTEGHAQWAKMVMPGRKFYLPFYAKDGETEIQSSLFYTYSEVIGAQTFTWSTTYSIAFELPASFGTFSLNNNFTYLVPYGLTWAGLGSSGNRRDVRFLMNSSQLTQRVYGDFQFYDKDEFLQVPPGSTNNPQTGRGGFTKDISNNIFWNTISGSQTNYLYSRANYYLELLSSRKPFGPSLFTSGGFGFSQNRTVRANIFPVNSAVGRLGTYSDSSVINALYPQNSSESIGSLAYPGYSYWGRAIWSDDLTFVQPQATASSPEVGRGVWLDINRTGASIYGTGERVNSKSFLDTQIVRNISNQWQNSMFQPIHNTFSAGTPESFTTSTIPNLIWNKHTNIMGHSGSNLLMDTVVGMYMRNEFGKFGFNLTQSTGIFVNPQFGGSVIDTWFGMGTQSLQRSVGIQVAQEVGYLTYRSVARVSEAYDYISARVSNGSTFSQIDSHVGFFAQSKLIGRQSDPTGRKTYDFGESRAWDLNGGPSGTYNPSGISRAAPRSWPTYSQYLVNKPWAFYAERDKSNLGGGLLIDMGATFGTPLRAFLEIEGVTQSTSNRPFTVSSTVSVFQRDGSYITYPYAGVSYSTFSQTYPQVLLRPGMTPSFQEDGSLWYTPGYLAFRDGGTTYNLLQPPSTTGGNQYIRVSATQATAFTLSTTYFATQSSPTISNYSSSHIYVIDFKPGNTQSVELNINNIGTYSVFKDDLVGGLTSMSLGDITSSNSAGLPIYFLLWKNGFFQFYLDDPTLSQVSGSGVANYVPVWTSTKVLKGTSSIYISSGGNGNVGVNLKSFPDYSLQTATTSLSPTIALGISGSILYNDGSQGSTGSVMMADASGRTNLFPLVLPGPGLTGVSPRVSGEFSSGYLPLYVGNTSSESSNYQLGPIMTDTNGTLISLLVRPQAQFASSNPQPTATFTASITGNILTVTGIQAGIGNIVPPASLSGTGVTTGTRITENISGTGSIGTYRVNISQTATETLMVSTRQRARNLTLVVPSLASTVPTGLTQSIEFLMDYGNQSVFGLKTFNNQTRFTLFNSANFANIGLLNSLSTNISLNQRIIGMGRPFSTVSAGPNYTKSVLTKLTGASTHFYSRTALTDTLASDMGAFYHDSPTSGLVRSFDNVLNQTIGRYTETVLANNYTTTQTGRDNIPNFIAEFDFTKISSTSSNLNNPQTYIGTYKRTEFGHNYATTSQDFLITSSTATPALFSTSSVNIVTGLFVNNQIGGLTWSFASATNSIAVYARHDVDNARVRNAFDFYSSRIGSSASDYRIDNHIGFFAQSKQFGSTAFEPTNRTTWGPNVAWPNQFNFEWRPGSNKPWAFFAESDKSSFGGGVIIDNSATFGTPLDAWLKIKGVSSSNDWPQIMLQPGTGPANPVTGSLWYQPIEVYDGSGITFLGWTGGLYFRHNNTTYNLLQSGGGAGTQGPRGFPGTNGTNGQNGATGATGATGVASIGAFNQSVSYANGANLNAGVLTLGAATITNPGLIHSGSQTFSGNKEFRGNVLIGPTSFNNGLYFFDGGGTTYSGFIGPTAITSNLVYRLPSDAPIDRYLKTCTTTDGIISLVWATASAPASGLAVPSNQIVFGNGTGVTSDADFCFNSTNCDFIVSSLPTNTSSQGFNTIIGGNNHTLSTVNRSAIIGGDTNTINSSDCSLIITSKSSCICPGPVSGASIESAVIIGGNNNKIVGSGSLFATIISGNNQYILGTNSNNTSILGGYANKICKFSENSSIIGGASNTIHHGRCSSIISAASSNICLNVGALPSECLRSNLILGGLNNTITGTGSEFATILNGNNQRIWGQNSNNSGIIGGSGNLIATSSNNSFIIGGQNSKMCCSARSVIIGGDGLTLQNDDDQVFVSQLMINSVASDSNQTLLLAWSSVDKTVYYRDVSTIAGGPAGGGPTVSIRGFNDGILVGSLNLNTGGFPNGATLSYNSNKLGSLTFSAATSENPGMVSLTTQSFKGEKTFLDDVFVGSTANTSQEGLFFYDTNTYSTSFKYTGFVAPNGRYWNTVTGNTGLGPTWSLVNNFIYELPGLTARANQFLTVASFSTATGFSTYSLSWTYPQVGTGLTLSNTGVINLTNITPNTTTFLVATGAPAYFTVSSADNGKLFDVNTNGQVIYLDAPGITQSYFDNNIGDRGFEFKVRKTDSSPGVVSINIPEIGGTANSPTGYPFVHLTRQNQIYEFKYNYGSQSWASYQIDMGLIGPNTLVGNLTTATGYAEEYEFVDFNDPIQKALNYTEGSFTNDWLSGVIYSSVERLNVSTNLSSNPLSLLNVNSGQYIGMAPAGSSGLTIPGFALTRGKNLKVYLSGTYSKTPSANTREFRLDFLLAGKTINSRTYSIGNGATPLQGSFEIEYNLKVRNGGLSGSAYGSGRMIFEEVSSPGAVNYLIHNSYTQSFITDINLSSNATFDVQVQNFTPTNLSFTVYNSTIERLA